MMRDLNEVWAKIVTLIGAAVLVRHWPSRRRIRQLEAENRKLQRFVRLADGCAQAVAEGCDSLTNVR